MKPTISLSRTVPLRDLDGGGTTLRHLFVDFIWGVPWGSGQNLFRRLRKVRESALGEWPGIGSGCDLAMRMGRRLVGRPLPMLDRVFPKAFEWCSGPGFIGFYLLQYGICEKLCLADINPRAIESVRRTVEENGLQDRVTFYVSDNLRSIPPEEKFDLVVSNPPNYFNVNPNHPIGARVQEDLRPNDRDWNIHRTFYRSILSHMNPGGLLLISEVEATSNEVFIPTGSSVPYDVRPRPPVVEFREMIEQGGLEYVDTVVFRPRGRSVELSMMISRAPKLEPASAR